MYICGSRIQEATECSADDNNTDVYIKDKIFVRENLDCTSKIELPYYSVGKYKDVCVYCGCEENIVPSPNFYPKCTSCADETDVKRMKRRIISSDYLKGAKKQKLLK